jgi:multidrug efflux pump subunit AcrA (membrane-fusion protein)
MKETMKKISAGLLTLAVIGGVGGYLADTLVASQAKPATEVTTVQTTSPAIETVTVVGTRRAS